MKKLTLAVVLTAIVSIVLVSFYSFHSSNSPVVKKDNKQAAYYWIYWGCQSYGSSFNVYTGPNGYNVFQTFGTNSPNPNQCPPPTSSGVCAVRFDFNETEQVPGLDGYRRPKASTNVWASGRVYITCPY